MFILAEIVTGISHLTLVLTELEPFLRNALKKNIRKKEREVRKENKTYNYVTGCNLLFVAALLCKQRLLCL